MSVLRTVCQACRSLLTLKAELEGKKIRCPRCGAVTLARAVDSVEEEAIHAPTKQTPAKAAPVKANNIVPKRDDNDTFADEVPRRPGPKQKSQRKAGFDLVPVLVSIVALAYLGLLGCAFFGMFDA